MTFCSGPAAVWSCQASSRSAKAKEQTASPPSVTRSPAFSPLATEGSGYGEVFDAALALHRGRPGDAAAALARVPQGSWYGCLFSRWRAELAAELPH
jgi:hypothetical protein